MSLLSRIAILSVLLTPLLQVYHHIPWPCWRCVSMLLLCRLSTAGILFQGYHSKGLGRSHRQAGYRSAWAPGRGLCGRLESRWTKSWQWRQGQGDSNLAELEGVDSRVLYRMIPITCLHVLAYRYDMEYWTRKFYRSGAAVEVCLGFS